MPIIVRFAKLRSASALLPLVMTWGCVLGPNFHAPAAPSVSDYTSQPTPEQTVSAATSGGEPQAFVRGMDIPGQWWALFQSPAIDDLVEQALRANPDLKAAQAALRGAREIDAAQRGALFPTVGAGYGASRQQASSTIAPPLTSGADLYTLHTATLDIAYVPDVFGGVRRQIETTTAQAQAQRFQTEAAYLTLTSNVVAAAIQEASLRGQVAATEAMIEANRAILDAMRRQKALGQIASGDVAAQEQALYQAQATLPPLQKQLEQQRHLIAALTGRFPSQTPGDALDLSQLQLPRALPVSLPAKLVVQRPDVRAAEANLHAASAQIGVAIANRLPNFDLTATAGGASQTLGTLFSNGDGFWSVAGGVAQPIFQGGMLLHRQRAAEAAYDQAGAQYQSTVIAAFQNVADVLAALKSDADQLQAAAGAERSASDALEIARKQYQLGQASSLAALTAEVAYQQTVLSRIPAQASRYADTAALFQALGGGWWNRSDATATLER
jgi:NodT family efflux transporter outer membrane factor (OMF) lipoprotein